MLLQTQYVASDSLTCHRCNTSHGAVTMRSFWKRISKLRSLNFSFYELISLQRLTTNIKLLRMLTVMSHLQRQIL